MNKNLDLNQIAALEKAISQKYGDLAVQNPAYFWNQDKEKEYLEQLKEVSKKTLQKEEYEEKEHNGFYVRGKLFTKEQNNKCSKCGIYSTKMFDDLYLNKFDCCYTCYVKHIEGKK
jgi:hypothetical protein